MPTTSDKVRNKKGLSIVPPAVAGLARGMFSPITPPGKLPPYDFSDSNRAALHDQIASLDTSPLSPHTCTYLSAVDIVNTELDKEGVPLTPKSHALIRHSIGMVGRGMSGPTLAHGTEATTFARQFLDGMRRRQFSSAIDGAIGATANVFGMMLTGVREHMELKRPRSS